MMIVISVIVIGSLFFISKGYSQNPDDVEAKKLYLKERALSKDKAKNLNTDDYLRLFKEAFAKNEDLQRSKRTAWFSTNSNDLNPLKGTTWIMVYNIGEDVYADVLTFGTQVSKTSDGTVGLSASNQNGDSGAVFYCDLLQGGRGFGVIINGALYQDFYDFTIINSSIPQGFYSFQSDDYSSSQHSLTGMKWGSDIVSGSNNCVTIGNDLGLGVSCATYNGNKYGFVLNNISSSTDPFGYYWKLDINTFTAK